MDELQGLLSQMESNAQPAANPEPSQQKPADPQPGQTTPEPQAGNPGSAPAQGQQPPAQQPGQSPSVQTPQQVFDGDRTTKAFAEMRIENTNMRRLIGGLASALGVQNPDQVGPAITALNQKLIEYQAKAQNIPPEILERLSKAEQFMQQAQLDQHSTQASLGFQKVKDTFHLSDADLVEFAQKLNEQGKNPFSAPMDLIQEYRTIYFDKLLEAARTEAANAALERQKKGETHGSQPSSVQTPPSVASGTATQSLRDVLAQMDGK